MAQGFRVADATVGVTFDRDQIRDELAKLPAELDPAVDKIGRDAGRRLGTSLGDGVDGNTVGRTIGDEVDKSLQPRAQKSGSDSGDKLSQGMRLAVIRNSPIIAAAAGAALAAGAPVMTAAAGALFIGIAAAAVHSNEQVQAAFAALKTTVTTTFTSAAQVTVPMFVAAMGRIGSAVQALGPQFHSIFAALGGPIDSLTTGIINMAQNAMPGLVRAVQASGPVFQGLASMMGSIGTGLGQFFSIIAQHSAAAGQAFSAIGQIVQELLPILGTLLGEGAELASQVLPPLASILHVVGDALHVIAPILPAVAEGFLAFKLVGALSGPMSSFATSLDNVAQKGGLFAGVAGKMSGAASGVAGALGPIGVVAGVAALGIGLVTSAIAAHNRQVQQDTMSLVNWYQTIASGGAGATQAMQKVEDKQKELSAAQDKLNELLANQNSVYQSAGRGAGAYNAVINEQQGKVRDLTKEFHDAWQQLTPTQQAQVKLNQAISDYGASSPQAAAAASHLNAVQATATATQDAAASAADRAAIATGTQTQKLQALANQASAANSQISLLNSALAALTGTNVSEAQAEDAVTQALTAVTNATQGQTGAAVTNTGEINRNTAAGASLDQTLINVGTSMQNQIAVMAQHGASTDVLTQKTNALWNQFVIEAEKAGLSATAAQNLANAYFGIPGQVVTTVSTNDYATPVINRVQQALNALQNKSITVTTYYKEVYSGPAGIGAAQAGPHALGGIMLPMASGGVLPMMGSGSANIFEPNDPVVLIGDNKRVRESFIPQDDSPRSRRILSETASEMGYRLVSNSDGGTVAPMGGGGGDTYYNVTVNIPTGTVLLNANDIPAAVVKAMKQAILKDDRASR